MTDTTEGPEFVLRSGAYFLQTNGKTWAVGINNAGRMTRQEAEAQKARFESQEVVTIHRAAEFMLPQAPAEPAEWVIRHNGYFYRRNAQGYTASLAAAGRWTKAEAEKHRNDDPLHRVTIHHQSEFAISGDPLETLEKVAIEIFEQWDKDQRPGKLLLALAGRLDGYRPDVDALRSFLKAPEAQA